MLEINKYFPQYFNAIPNFLSKPTFDKSSNGDYFRCINNTSFYEIIYLFKIHSSQYLLFTTFLIKIITLFWLGHILVIFLWWGFDHLQILGVLNLLILIIVPCVHELLFFFFIWIKYPLPEPGPLPTCLGNLTAPLLSCKKLIEYGNITSLSVGKDGSLHGWLKAKHTRVTRLILRDNRLSINIFIFW